MPVRTRRTDRSTQRRLTHIVLHYKGPPGWWANDCCFRLWSFDIPAALQLGSQASHPIYAIYAEGWANRVLSAGEPPRRFIFRDTVITAIFTNECGGVEVRQSLKPESPLYATFQARIARILRRYRFGTSQQRCFTFKGSLNFRCDWQRLSAWQRSRPNQPYPASVYHLRAEPRRELSFNVIDELHAVIFERSWVRFFIDERRRVLKERAENDPCFDMSSDERYALEREVLSRAVSNRFRPGPLYERFEDLSSREKLGLIMARCPTVAKIVRKSQTLSADLEYSLATPSARVRGGGFRPAIQTDESLVITLASAILSCSRRKLQMQVRGNVHRGLLQHPVMRQSLDYRKGHIPSKLRDPSFLPTSRQVAEVKKALRTLGKDAALLLSYIERFPGRTIPELAQIIAMEHGGSTELPLSFRE